MEQTYFYAQDQIGSVTAMIDTQGKIAGTALYSPWQIAAKAKGVQTNIAIQVYHHKAAYALPPTEGL